MTGRFLSTHSIVLSLPLHVDHLPDRGSSVKAKTALSRPGGGFTTLSAVAAWGVSTASLSLLGTGPNSFTVRQQLGDAGIEVLTDELVGDIGVAVMLMEADGSTTAVITSGVEAEPSLRTLERVDLHAGDLVHISAADLTTDVGAEVLSSWGERLPEGIMLVLAVSPAVNEIPLDALLRLLSRADVVTMNVREASILNAMLGSYKKGTRLADHVGDSTAIVRRLGVMGCEVQVDKTHKRIQIPAFNSITVDTAGVGDTHIATMCASLLLGEDLVGACRTANAASAITISHESALPVPTPDQVKKVLMSGGLHVDL